MDYADNLVEWYKLTFKTIASRLSENIGKEITSEEVGKAISEIYGFTDNTEVYSKLYEEGLGLFEIIKDHHFSVKIGVVELIDDDRILTTDDDQELLEALVKNNNQQWVIHKNDKDPFPSNPHGHNYESGLKLDLSNGDLYKKKKKRSSISKRELKKIRKKCTDKGIILPVLNV